MVVEVEYITQAKAATVHALQGTVVGSWTMVTVANTATRSASMVVFNLARVLQRLHKLSRDDDQRIISSRSSLVNALRISNCAMI